MVIDASQVAMRWILGEYKQSRIDNIQYGTAPDDSRAFTQDIHLYFHVWVLTCESLIPITDRIAISRAAAEKKAIRITSIFVTLSNSEKKPAREMSTTYVRGFI